jgi:hypothetical protein
VRADECAHPGHAVVRSAEALRKRRRQRHLLERHVGVQRAVAEQHVEQLPGVAADRLGAQSELREAAAIGLQRHVVDARHHLAQHALVEYRFGRHLDALLECQRLGAPGGLVGRYLQAVGGENAIIGHAAAF